LRKRPNFVVVALLILAAGIGLVGGLTWLNYQFAKENPGGNDFLVQWMGTRLLLTEGINPYSDEAAQQAQRFTYGRLARDGESEMRFVYPLYAVIVYLPFALIRDFLVARAIWMTILELSLILLAVLSLRLVRWRTGPLMVVLIILFSLLWYHAVRPLITGNIIILIALALVGGLLAIRNGMDELAGLLFAFTTIKPNVIILAVAFICFWAFNRGRMRVITWLFGTVILMAGAAALLVPDWIVHNFLEILRFPTYGPPGTLQAAFVNWWPAFGARLGIAVTAVAAFVLMVEWWSNRHAEFRGLLWTVCLTLVLSQWIGIQTDPGNFIILYPAILLVFAVLSERWRAVGSFINVLCVVALFAGIWAIFLNTVEQGLQPVQSPVMFFPLPAFLLIMLYWVRWWAIEPPTVWYELLEN